PLAFFAARAVAVTASAVTRPDRRLTESTVDVISDDTAVLETLPSPVVSTSPSWNTCGCCSPSAVLLITLPPVPTHGMYRTALGPDCLRLPSNILCPKAVPASAPDAPGTNALDAWAMMYWVPTGSPSGLF